MTLIAEHITVRHHPKLPPAVVDVSVSIQPGEIVALVGGNGSGKSTLARALTGLIPLEKGRVLRRVGLVLQDPAAQAITETVADDIAWGPEHSGQPAEEIAQRVSRLIAAGDLASVYADNPAKLSGGQQQRAAIAALLACDVDVLVLDEPTALLDKPARERFMQVVQANAQHRGILWITQEPNELAICTRVIVLDAGYIVWEGAVEDYIDNNLAQRWELGLPDASRIAFELANLGAWPLDDGDGAPGRIPKTMEELTATLIAEHHDRGSFPR